MSRILFKNKGNAAIFETARDFSLNTNINKTKQINGTEQPMSSPVRFGTIILDPNFTGREKELRTLDVYYEKPHHIVVVYGLGGIGKTSLVRKYVENNKFKSHNVIWINVKQRESIEADFKSIATDYVHIRTFNTEGRKKNFKAILDNVLSELCKFPTLIVLNNVDDEESRKFAMESVVPIRPSGSHRPRYIITSRIEDWNRNSVSVMPLRGLNDTEAVKLVTKLLAVELKSGESPPKNTPEEIKELIGILQNFTLTIRQATAHINHQRKTEPFSITKYISEYNSYKKEYLSSEYFKIDNFEYKETTFTTWKATMAAIGRNQKECNLALRILRIMVYFEADHIRRDIFFHLKHPSSDNKVDEKDIKSAVRLLANYSMVEGREHQSILSVHRLVQSVMKIDMDNDPDMANTALRDGLHILNKVLADKNFKNVEENLPHGMSVFLSALTEEDLVKEFSFFPLVLLNKANECGRYQTFGYKILPRLTEILSGNDLNIINAKSELAISYFELGKHAEALSMFEDVHKNRLENLNADHPDTIRVKCNMANSYSEMGKHAKALQMHKDIYQKQLGIWGPDHPDTISSKANISRSYFRAGRHFGIEFVKVFAVRLLAALYLNYYSESFYSRKYGLLR